MIQVSRKVTGVVARLFNRLLNWRGRNGASPNLEFAVFDDAPGIIGLHFQNDASRGRGGRKFLPPGNPGHPPQFP